jgi:hypothetical protein
MFVGDMFVPYVRYEVRFWFVAVLLAMVRLSDEARDVPEPVHPAAAADDTDQRRPPRH